MEQGYPTGGAAADEVTQAHLQIALRGSWIGLLLDAAKGFRLGSLLLLAGALLLPLSLPYVSGIWTIDLFGAIGGAAYVWAWISLRAAVATLRGVKLPWEEGVARGVTLAYRASIFGLLAGLLLTIFALDALVLIVAPAFWGILAYVPGVFAPVVVSHSALFLKASRGLGRGGLSAPIVAGSTILVALGLVAVAAQVLLLANPPDGVEPAWYGVGPVIQTLAVWPLLLIPGLTSLGYTMIVQGLQAAVAPAPPGIRTL